MMISFPQFPNSTIDPFLATSPTTPLYNCIAWAYEDPTRWYWPNDMSFWPENIQREESIDAFIQLFIERGYKVCTTGDLEAGYKKIAIYEKNGVPTHAARQLNDGFWTSKLGMSLDVSHSIFGMRNGDYGDIAVFMKRQIVF